VDGDEDRETDKQMIIEHRDETLIRIYRCGICHGVYSAQVGLYRITCAVNHPPGACCHFHEKALSLVQLQQIQVILKELKPLVEVEMAMTDD